MSDTKTPRKRMKIYRFADGQGLTREKMPFVGMNEGVIAGFSKLAQVGNSEDLGGKTLILFEDEAAGMSLTYAWFKSGYVLPKHSHDADCLYYVIGGSLTMGTQTLGKGDGMFIPAEDGYTYEVGPDGVEVLEFRTAVHFHINFDKGNDDAHWDRMVAAGTRGKEAWVSETVPPSERVTEPAE